MSAMRCATPTSPLPAASDSTAGASGHAHGLMEEGTTMGRKAGDIAAVVLLANALSLAIAGAAHAQSTSADTERIDQLEAKVRAQDEQITQLRQMLGEQQRTLDALDDRGRQWTQAQAGELDALRARSEEHTSELQSLMSISYAVFCLKKKNKQITTTTPPTN